MQISMVQAILLGLGATVFASGTLPLGWMSLNIMSRPLLISAVIGMIMGDTTTAIIIGRTIQTLYLGATSIGGVQSMPSIGTSMWFALPIAMTSGIGNVEETCALALTICLACAPVETALKSLMNGFKIAALHSVDALVEKGKLKSALVASYVWQNGLVFVQNFIPVVLLCNVGQEAVLAAVALLPAWVSGVISVWTSLLRLLGFSLLLVTLVKNNAQWLLFLMGFALVKSAGFNILTLTLVSLGIAYIVFVTTGFKGKAEVAVAAAGDFDDDLS